MPVCEKCGFEMSLSQSFSELGSRTVRFSGELVKENPKEVIILLGALGVIPVVYSNPVTGAVASFTLSSIAVGAAAGALNAIEVPCPDCGESHRWSKGED